MDLCEFTSFSNKWAWVIIDPLPEIIPIEDVHNYMKIVSFSQTVVETVLNNALFLIIDLNMSFIKITSS